MRTIRLLTFLAAGVFGAQAALIHQYLFNSDLTDSAGAANGSAFGGATVAGGVLTLNGASQQYVEFGEYIVPVSGSYTVVLDEQVGAGGFGAGIFELISQGGGPGFYIGFYGPFFRMGDDWSDNTVSYPQDAAWHRIALVVDAAAPAESRFYIDGLLAGSVSHTVSTGLSGTNTRFGRQYGSHAEYFTGSLDNVRIFDTALSAGEIADLDSGIPEPSTVALSFLGLTALATVRRRKR